MEPFEWHGQWQVPTSDQRVGGTLRYSDADGLRLSVFGRLTPGNQAFLASEGYSLVHGVTTDGKWVTLARCLASGNSWNSSGTGSEQIWAHECYVGAHFESLDELEFDRAKLNFRFLGDWVRSTGITKASDGFSFSAPDELVAETPRAEVRLGFDANYSYRAHHASIAETPVLVVEARSAYAMPEFDSALYRPLRHLFTLIFGCPSPVDDIILFSPHVLNGANGRRMPIGFIRQPLSVSSERRLTRPFLPYSWFRDRWNTVIPDWFRIAGELEPVCNLLSSLHEMEHTFVEPRFLLAVQALEGYHRRRFPNEAISRDQYRAKVQGVLEKLPEELRDWVKASFERLGNEPSLRDRLSDLLEKTQNALLGTFDGASFVSAATSARNALTHYDPKRKKSSPDGGSILLLGEQSRLILETLLVQELGASNEEVLQMVSNSDRAERIMRLRSSGKT